MSLTRRDAARLAVLSAAGLAARPAAAQATTVTLGVSAPITGNQAQYGQDIRRGAELAVEQLNAKKPIADTSFALVVED